MRPIEAKSYAEVQASRAEGLPAFSGLNLLHIKRGVAELLSQIGSIGIFEHYTRHDISHIDAMLRLLAWIVPEDSKKRLTAADWLMTVLAVYFHDLAMLVTRDEFAARERSGFADFCRDTLFAGDAGVDYKAKVLNIPQDIRDRFLYQEYVRHTHAERIRNWVLGVLRPSLGVAEVVIKEIDSLLAPLDSVFRADLGVICESHHLDDLGEFKKYKPRQPYGQDPEEKANLQYCAVLLRTADLLHVTKDRTPSLTFRLLNPTDPISQEEWAKQMAVRAVQPQPGRDRNGNFSDDAPRDTVEVHARFEVPAGFFALTKYMSYVQGQLRMSHDWIERARIEQGTGVSFPWRFVDTSNVETAGFLSKTFEFNIDQEKILDLLTGHTLYNDARVVLRELVQNSLDAVRLQCLEKRRAAEKHGRVDIHWDPGKKILTIQDNGTGMTQEIIENHLLKVGSSRYQTTEFKKKHPQFSPISRFGIGILSTFMIADTVEITTVCEQEPKGRRLTLQSVHGRYLVSLLDKEADLDARSLLPHGTRIRLHVRPSAKFSNPLASAQQWVVLPGCEVIFQRGADVPIPVGYRSLKEALTDYLVRTGFDVSAGDSPPKPGDVRVFQSEDEKRGVSLAVAVRWSAFFLEWEFMNIPEETRLVASRRTVPQEKMFPISSAVGTCIEGIRVSTESPGYEGRSLFALANAAGPRAPKTNVARSALEQTAELEDALTGIYELYASHVQSELDLQSRRRGFSITWAVQESKFMTKRLLGGRTRDDGPLRPRLFGRALATKVPLLLVETESGRANIGLNEFEKFQKFWTVHGYVFRSAEGFLRELETSASLRAIDSAVGGAGLSLPAGVVLCGDFADHPLRDLFFNGREPLQLGVNHAQRRLDVLWGTVGPECASSWIRFSIPREVLRRALPAQRTGAMRLLYQEIWICKGAVELKGAQDEEFFYADGRVFVRPGTPLATLFEKVANLFEQGALSIVQQSAVVEMLMLIENMWVSGTKTKDMVVKDLSRFYDDRAKYLSAVIPESEVREVILSGTGQSFDPEAWSRELQERQTNP